MKRAIFPKNYAKHVYCINIQKKCGLINDYLKNKDYLCGIILKTKKSLQTICQKI